MAAFTVVFIVVEVLGLWLCCRRIWWRMSECRVPWIWRVSLITGMMMTSASFYGSFLWPMTFLICLMIGILVFIGTLWQLTRWIPAQQGL